MHAAQTLARMLDTIVCPACRGRLTLTEHPDSISCTACSRRYSLKDGIPVLITERATT